MEAAVDEYLSVPKPTTDEMFDNLFANPPKGLAEQREVARRYASGGQHAGTPGGSANQNAGKPTAAHHVLGHHAAGHSRNGAGDH